MSGLCALILGVAPAQAATQTFFFTGAEQTFQVPAGVTSINVVAIGAAGGAGGGLGGSAMQVTADLNVTPGQTLYVEVGGIGTASGGGGAGGFNGGGAGAGGAGGGGGASDVRTSPLGAGLSPDHRLIVAAGGGGGGGTAASEGGAGGAAGFEGEEGGEGSGNFGGGPGTAVGGGFGGLGNGTSGTAGQLGLGGGGGSGESGTNGGGGGGAGYYGGGGGGGGLAFGGGGGGGGSSLVPPLGIPALVLPATEPQIQITYNLVPPSITFVSPTDGATYAQGQVVNAVYFCTPPEGGAVEICEGPVASGTALDTSALGPHTFKVFAEDTDGATVAESVDYTVVAAPLKPPPTNPVVGPTPQPIPDTVLGSHPKELIKTKKKKVKVKFSFTSTVAGATFECKLDKGSFEPCTSPKSYMVKVGKHKFSVQAVSAGGTDPAAVAFDFKIKKKQ